MNVSGRLLSLVGMIGVAMGQSGCGQGPSGESQPAVTSAANARGDAPADRRQNGKHEGKEQASAPHDHSGWWCNEHGVPEEECGQCNAKLAAAFQKKGDWCREHDRPDSQCFLCHPEKEAVFAAKYEAKYGKLPPKPE